MVLHSIFPHFYAILFLLYSFVELSILILKLKAKKLFGSMSKTLSKDRLASVEFPALYNVKALTVSAEVLFGSIASTLSIDAKASPYFPRIPRAVPLLIYASMLLGSIDNA